MKTCHICWCSIPKNHYKYRTKSSSSIFACATCRLLFERSVRKNENDFCHHGAVLRDNCSACHFFKCTSMGMTKLKIFNGKSINFRTLNLYFDFWIKLVIFQGTLKEVFKKLPKNTLGTPFHSRSLKAFVTSIQTSSKKPKSF